MDIVGFCLTCPNFASKIGHKGRTRKSGVLQLDFTVQGPLTRSKGMDHKKKTNNN